MFEDLIHYILEGIRNLSDVELSVFLLLLAFVPLTFGLWHACARKR